MENRPIQEIIDDAGKLLHDKKMSSADEWGDLGTEVRLIIYKKTIEVLSLEIAASQKKVELRAKLSSAVDAENEWKTTDEYKKWQEVVVDLDRFDKVERSFRNQATLRKN